MKGKVIPRRLCLPVLTGYRMKQVIMRLLLINMFGQPNQQLVVAMVNNYRENIAQSLRRRCYMLQNIGHGLKRL